MVVIVDDPELGPVFGNVVGHEGRGRCKHLVGDEPGKLSCAVHDRPWYGETPCAEYGQVEQSPDDPCRMGQHILQSLELVQQLRERLKVSRPPVRLDDPFVDEAFDFAGEEDPT